MSGTVDSSAPTLESVKTRVAAKLRSFPNFPKAGIQFWDIMPLLSDASLMRDLCAAIAAHLKQAYTITAVAGLEARGFLFGPQIAMLLGVPFLPLRKPGKLPGDLLRSMYKKEYGEDIIETQRGSLAPGNQVALIDDLLATGGTMNAAVHLINAMECKSAVVFVLIELEELKGRESVPKGVPVESLIKH